MNAVLAKPQVKDFLKTLAKGKEKGQEQRKEHDVNAHAVTAEGEPSKKPWEEDIPELSSPSYSPPTSFSYSSDSASSSNPRRKRVTKRKKVVNEPLLEQTLENGVALSEVVAKSKKSTVRKKMDMPVLDSTVMDAPAAEEAAVIQSRRRKKRSISVDVESKGAISSCNFGKRVFLIDSIDPASFSTSPLPLGGPRRSPRKKKASTSVLPVEEIIDKVAGATQEVANSATDTTQDNKTLKEKSSNVNCMDGAIRDSPVMKARKKVSSSSTPVEEIGTSANETIQESKALKEKSSDKNDMDGVIRETPKRKVRKKMVTSSSSMEEMSVGTEIDTMKEKLRVTKKFSLASDATVSPARVGVESSFSYIRWKGLKVEYDAAQMTILTASSESISTGSIQKRENEVHEKSPSPGSDRSANIALEKLVAKGTSNVQSTFSKGFKVDSTLEPFVPQEVREVQNSIDKASLTDDMPVISFAYTHSAYRRKQSETVSLENNFDIKSAAKAHYDLAKISVASTKASSQASSLLQDALDSFLGLAGQNITYHKKEGFASHASRSGMPRYTSNVQKQMAPGRSPTREGINYSNIYSANHERSESNSQHRSKWSKSSTRSAAEALVQRHEASDRQQVVNAEQSEKEGYALVNIDRAHGRERKKRKDFSVRNIVANQASTISYMQIFGTGFDTGDTAPTVLLFFDRRRFFFNVGEGLHRFCMEHKFKLSKIDHVFLTRVCSETVGGLPDYMACQRRLSPTEIPDLRVCFGRQFGRTLARGCSSRPHSTRRLTGQPEIANSVFLDLLKSYFSDQKTQWERCLPLVEFAYNNTIHSSTGKAPFEIVEGVMKVPPFLSTKDKILEANEYTKDLDTDFAKVRETLQKSQERQKKAADCHRCDLKLKENDWITEQINDISFRLRLPDTWKIHNVFHVNLWKTFGDVPDDGEPDEQPEVEVNEEILVPEQVLAHKVTKKGRARRRFLIEFKNFPAFDAKWMEEEDLADTSQIMKLYLEAFGLA
ncbi:hypothetical protein L7F22_047239 [Adiantum nelumboides]|nr:hypothetical protein [Adiantum nelumboides]